MVLALAAGGLLACERSSEGRTQTAQDATAQIVAQAVDAPPEDVEGGTVMIKGDIEYGAYLAAECVTCHQADGSDQGLPSITGWDAESFVVVMKSYKDKERENEAMQTIAGRLDEEMIGSLALYFAEQDAPN